MVPNLAGNFLEETYETNKEYGSMRYCNDEDKVVKTFFFQDGLCKKTKASFSVEYLSVFIKSYNENTDCVKTGSTTWLHTEKNIEVTITLFDDKTRFTVKQELL